MLPNELVNIIGRRRFIAEVRTGTARQALGVVEALARGGITVFEIAIAIPGASEILHHFSNQSEILVGAGGVVDPQQVVEVAAAGGRFVIAPITAPDILHACQQHNLGGILGALSPTEIIMAHRAGSELIKVFPINAVGGSQYLRSILRQFVSLNLIVSGGITLETLPEYLALPVRVIALGSTLMPRALVERGDWGTLAAMAHRYVEYAAAWDAAMPAQGQGAASRPLIGDTTMVPASGNVSQPPMPIPQFPQTPYASSLPIPDPAIMSPFAMPQAEPPPLPDAPFRPWDSPGWRRGR